MRIALEQRETKRSAAARGGAGAVLWLLLPWLVLGCEPASIHLDDAPADPAADDPTPSEDTGLPDPPDEPGDSGEPDDEGGPAPDYSQPGPYAVLTQPFTAEASCAMSAQIFRPDGQAIARAVVAHGWQRDGLQMTEWAEHWASWGVEVAVPVLCHSQIFDTDHGVNGQDLIALAEQMPSEAPLVYAGHGTGGLSALLAAQEDPTARAILGLDLVDHNDHARPAAATLTIPLLGLLGAAEPCNRHGNGAKAYPAAADGRAFRVHGARYCDFEAPTDANCTTFCNAQASTASHGTIRLLSTAAVLGVAKPVARQWWTPGTARWADLMDSGEVSPL